ncbi:MAG: hypothetical protein WC871_07065, partial [Bacteroidales bacterium]
MSKRIVYILIIVLLVLLGLVRFDRYLAQKSKTKMDVPVHAEIGDLLFRSFSYTVASSSLYRYSGMPGHVAIIITEGEFLPDEASYSAIKVIEARYYDRSKKKKKNNRVGINPADINFGEKYKGQRFLLKTHLNDKEKAKLVAYSNSQIGKPYNLFADKHDTMEYNCATFVRHVLDFTAKIDVDGDGGSMFFPNDIFDYPLYLETNNR